MKKIIIPVMTAVILSLLVCGCSPYTAFTFTSMTGEQCKVELDTTQGHELTMEDTYFAVKKDGEEILTGIFLDEEMRQSYIDSAHADENSEILSDTEEYFAWKANGDDGMELYRITDVKDSEIYVLTASKLETDSDEVIANDAYEQLTFTNK